MKRAMICEATRDNSEIGGAVAEQVCKNCKSDITFVSEWQHGNGRSDCMIYGKKAEPAEPSATGEPPKERVLIHTRCGNEFMPRAERGNQPQEVNVMPQKRTPLEWTFEPCRDCDQGIDGSVHQPGHEHYHPFVSTSKAPGVAAESPVANWLNSLSEAHIKELDKEIAELKAKLAAALSSEEAIKIAIFNGLNCYGPNPISPFLIEKAARAVLALLKGEK